MPSYSSTGNMTGNQMADGYIRITCVEVKSSIEGSVNVSGS